MKSGRDIAPTGDAYSFNNFGKGTAAPSRNLDHIFYRNTKMAVSFRTLTDNYGVKYVSDHYPILLTVRSTLFRRKPPRLLRAGAVPCFRNAVS